MRLIKMKNILLFFLLLEITILGKYHVVSGCLFTPKHHVHIVSNLPPNSSPLKVHCASGNDNLGHHTLYPNQDYQWSFCLNLIANTLFFCHLWWESKDTAFEVFHERWNKVHADQSWWIANKDGIYFSNQTQPTILEKRYDWNN